MVAQCEREVVEARQPVSIIFNPKKYASGRGIDANICSILQPLHLSQNSLAFISFLESTTTRA